MFKVKGDKAAAQAQLATDIMNPEVQSAFNVLKGSVPARTDVSDAAFDDCGKRDMKELAQAARNNTLVGSIAHGHAVPAAVKNAFYDVITRHFNGQLDDKKAVAALAAAARQ
jgi:glucose/mannose transport system substrate-binding protein